MSNFRRNALTAFAFLFTTSHAYATLVGETPTKFQVSPSGAATYTVPIQIPPGTNEIQPNLSLSYNSQAGNGLLGISWNIGGLSAITRCPATYVQDSFKGGIKFDQNDKLCLDGQRLLVVGTADGGTEYRTAINNFSKIIAYGTAGNGPAYFKVWTKSGQIMEYATTVDSGVEAKGRTDGAIIIWALSRIEDRNGNYLTVSYAEDTANGESYPTDIYYTGNTVQGITPTNHVQLNYESRPDVISRYIGGSALKTSKRLSSISTFTGSSLIKKYQIVYVNTELTGASQLTSIDECTGSGQCLPPIIFDWSDSRNIKFDGNDSGPTYWVQNIYYYNHSVERVRTGDFNGDGLTDIYHINGSGSSDPDSVYLSNGDGTFAPPVTKGAPDTSVAASDHGADTDISRVTFGDFNGDGLTDIYRINGTGGAEADSIYFSNGDGTFTSPVTTGTPVTYVATPQASIYNPAKTDINRIKMGDFNGDGLTDVYHINGWGNSAADSIYLSNGDGTFQQLTSGPVTYIGASYTRAAIDMSRIRFGDFNGDGLTDIYYINGGWGANSKDVIHFSNGDGTFTATPQTIGIPTLIDSSSTTSASIDMNRIRFGDFNGDGLTDVYYIHGKDSTETDTIYFSKGDGSFEKKNTGPAFLIYGSYLDELGYSLSTIELGDFNGDGMTDIYHINGTITGRPSSSVDNIYFSNGDGTFRKILTGPDTDLGDLPTYSVSRFRFGDFNGDGMTDVYNIRGYGDAVAPDRIYSNTFNKPLISNVTSSLLAETSIEYSTLTDKTIYAKDNTSSGCFGWCGPTFLPDGGTSPKPISPAQTINRDIQPPIYVVKQISKDNGIGSHALTSYTYRGMKVNLQGRGSLGFSGIDVMDITGDIKTSIDYWQGYPYTGMPKHSEKTVISTGQPLSRSDVVPAHTGGSIISPQKEIISPVAPYAGSTTEYIYDLNSGQILSTKTTNSTHDDYGNPTDVSVVTTGGGETFSEITANVLSVDTTNWCIGMTDQSDVTLTGADGSTILRTTTFGWDNTKCRLQQSTVLPGEGYSLEMTTDYGYDLFGNRTSETVSGPIDAISGLTDAPRTTTSDFLSNSAAYPDGQFATTAKNALLHSETREYDPKTGQITKLTGPNGISTCYEYDELGRQTIERQYCGTTSEIVTTTSYTWCDASCPQFASYMVTTIQAGSAPTTVYYDNLGREVRKSVVGFDGRQSYVDTMYDNKGWIAGVSQPYFDGDLSYWTEYIQYDVLGRITQMKPPHTTQLEATLYNGFTTTVTDIMGRKHSETKNAIGQMLSVTDDLNNTVTYTYDAAGNRTTTTDSAGNVITITYDRRDRKWTMNDPDMGNWSYSYNTFGELTTQTDAKNQITTMQYDVLGRMLQRTEPEGVTTWTYDTYDNIANGIVAHSIGKLLQVNAPDNYQQIMTYDDLGRSSTTTTTADGKTLATTTEYDSFSRVSRTIRPEGFVVDNVYNAQGYLEAVRTPAALIGDYNALHLSQLWNVLEPQLITELEQAQQQADELYAQAAVYRERAQYYWDSAQLVLEQAPNMQFLDDDRRATIAQLQQTSTDLNQLASKLESKAAEYQLLANSILSLMPTNWQTTWFLNAKARYDQYARDAIAKVEAAYQVYETSNTLVWTPIDVAGITIFIQVKPGFNGANALSVDEKQHLEKIGKWEAGTSSLLRSLAESARAQQAARDKYQAAIVDPLNPPLPEDVLTAEELQLYNAPDLLQTDGIALAEFYNNRAIEQVALQREVEEQREYYVRTASRLSQTIAAYSDAIAQLQGTESQVTFWRATSRDAAGRLTSSVVGNGLETRNFYDQASGQLTYITSGFGSSTLVRELSYEYDALNNVTSRTDHIRSMSETFQYDQLDRLTNSFVQGQIGGVDYNNSVDYSYDAMGNIWNKSDIGDYSYGDLTRSIGNAGPHALVSAGLQTGYQYDNNGNMLQGGGRDIAWSSFNKPIDFSKDGVWQASFKYGPDRARYLKVTPSSTTLYLGKSYERVETGTKVEQKYFIYADGEVVAIHVKTTDNAVAQLDQTRYLHRDSLGSIDTITDGQGQIVDLMSYEPFGTRRDGDWRVGTGALYIPTLTNRGFTGHEHIDEMDLIHMNGRVYDPQLGRFLSADPTIQFPYQSQGYNRYSYVQNNPLKYTDPSGYSMDPSTPRIDPYRFNFDTPPGYMGIPYLTESSSGGINLGAVATYSSSYFDVNGATLGSIQAIQGAYEAAISPIAQLNALSGDLELDGLLPMPSSGDLESRLTVSKTVEFMHHNNILSDPINLIDPYRSFDSSPSRPAQGYNKNDVRGGFNERGESLVYHPDNYNPNTASMLLVMGASTVFAPETLALRGSAIYATGGLKQWIRIGPSYSKALDKGISKSIRWGASPAHGGKYIQQIGSKTLQRFNQWLRGLKLPGTSWRTQDPGHFHIKK